MLYEVITALLQRQAGLGAVEGLDLALLVNRQNDGMGWRIDVETHDIMQFGGKLRVAGQLELPVAMGLQAMRFPDAADGAGADASGLCHHVGRPVGRFARVITSYSIHYTKLYDVSAATAVFADPPAGVSGGERQAHHDPAVGLDRTDGGGRHAASHPAPSGRAQRSGLRDAGRRYVV